MVFKEIDDKVNDAIVALEKYLENFDFPIEQATYFKLNEYFDKIDLPACSKQPGVYFFEMKVPSTQEFGVKINTRIQRLAESWKHHSVRKMWSPSIRQSRLNAHKVTGTNTYDFPNGWIPFYIGKSRNIEKRISEHIFQAAEKTSFGMKLKARKNLYEMEFRVSYVPINVANYDMIVPHVEKYMRHKLNPIAGKQ